MSDWAVLGGVAALLYLVECLSWTPRATWSLFRGARAQWTAARGADLPGNDRGGLVLGHPLIVSGAVVQSSEWPISLSPEGIVAAPASSQGDEPTYWPFDDIETVQTSLDDVVINRSDAIPAGSEVSAAWLAELIRGLVDAGKAKRENILSVGLAGTLDPEAIKAEWTRFQETTHLLRVSSWMPFIWLFILAPLVLVLFGPLASWPYLLAGLFLSSLTVTWFFFRAHRALYERARYDRWVQAVSMTLFPIAAIRAVDRLSKGLLSRFHPVAVVSVFCPEGTAQEVARREWFDVSRPADASTSSPADTCLSWHRAALTRHIEALSQRMGYDLREAPSKDDESMVHYCPRCHRQFGQAATACRDCDVALSLFPRAAASSGPGPVVT